ncbi:hypothetical protein SeMB42_g01341 [Synchytrium endobioticum]|uniref:Uncharacterized protein n=1 Tax=Synchytrium endobioticum TaxID=286115 RepID=A0A507DMB8_9FUNG|nr:hypothetical protein SeLEV6574_g04716 [Synchytrium endobioticum]TPX52561.1 hypothetical protein SeMB42_g01341 [Synchytrium endobioticum]
MNGNAQNTASQDHHTHPSQQPNGYANAAALGDQGNDLAGRLSDMLSSQIKSTMDYASVKAAATKIFVENKVNGAVDLSRGIAQKVDEIPVVHKTTSYVSSMIYGTMSHLFAITNYIKDTTTSAITTVNSAVKVTTSKASNVVTSSVSAYRQMAYNKATQVRDQGVSLAHKYLPTPIYDLGCKFVSDPVSTTRQRLPSEVVRFGDRAADVGMICYGMARDVSGMTKSNIDAVRNEALKKAAEAKKMAEDNLNWGMQTIGLCKKAKEE